VTLYSLALFLHIVGSLLLSTAFTVEGIGLFHMRRANTAEQVAQWEGVLGLARVFGPASVVTILLPGLYMMFTSWGWVPWIAVGLIAWSLIAVMGAVNGIRLSMIVRRTTADAAMIARLREPSFVVSWFTRLALAVSIVFLMTDKPPLVWSLLSVAVAAVIGVAAGVLATGAGLRPMERRSTRR
jgi:hypothetical protein